MTMDDVRILKKYSTVDQGSAMMELLARDEVSISAARLSL